MSQLSECSCSLSSEPLVAVYHELGRHYVNTYKSPYHSPAAILVLLLFERPAVILRGTGGIRVAKGQGAKRWPTCTSDIIPFGPDITVKSIGQWIILLPEPMPLTFLGLSLELCGGSLFTAVTASPTFLKQFIVAFRTDCARLRQPYRWQIILHHLWLIAEFLFRAMSAATSRNSITTWTRGFEVELLKVLSDATDICFDPRLTSSDSEEAATRPAMAANIFHAFGVHFARDVERPPGLHPRLALVEPKDDSDDSVTYAAYFIRTFRQDRRCHAAGCSNTFPEVGSTYQKCSACTVIAYCSTSCQVADWKDARYPHKEYCPKIQTFVAAGGGLGKLDDAESFMQGFDHEAGGTALSEIETWGRVRAAEKEAEDTADDLKALGLGFGIDPRTEGDRVGEPGESFDTEEKTCSSSDVALIAHV